MRNSTRQSALAFVGASALIMMMASPAAADDGGSGTIVDGTVTVDGTLLADPIVVDLGGDGDDPCDLGPFPDGSIEVTITGGSYDTEVTDLQFAPGFFQVPGDATNWYMLQLSYLDPTSDPFYSNSGELIFDAGLDYDVSQQLGVLGQITKVNVNNDCAPATTNPVDCFFALQMEFDSPSTYEDTNSDLSPDADLTGTAVLDGNKVDAVDTCPAPFSSIFAPAGTITMTGVTVNFTAFP